MCFDKSTELLCLNPTKDEVYLHNISKLSTFSKLRKKFIQMACRKALLSTLLHAIVYIFTQFLNELVQIANKIGLENKKKSIS
jgi:hypothetical protein